MRSVSLSDVMCKIQGKNAVNGISLNIKPGEIICFLGLQVAEKQQAFV